MGFSIGSETEPVKNADFERFRTTGRIAYKTWKDFCVLNQMRTKKRVKAERTADWYLLKSGFSWFATFLKMWGQVVAHADLWTLKLLGPTTFTTSSLCLGKVIGIFLVQ